MLWEKKYSKEFSEVFCDNGDVKKDIRNGFDDDINVNDVIIIIIFEDVFIERNILFYFFIFFYIKILIIIYLILFFIL